MIGIIGAMQIEVDAILSYCQNIEQHHNFGFSIVQATCNNTPVVIALSGIGKGAAAMVTTFLCSQYPLKGIINIGTAGGLWANQSVGDVVISTSVAYHDVDLTAFGYARGFSAKDFTYQADSSYIELFQDAPIEGNYKKWVGPIVSGDQFVSKKEQVEKIRQIFPQALCTEMEGAAVAQVCTFFNLPFIIIRSLSDIALQANNQISFNEYVELASQRSALWVYQKIDQINQLT